MQGPDGLEERTAYYEEYFSDADDEFTEDDYDDDLLDIASDRIESLSEAL